jgi:hypothetical protein
LNEVVTGQRFASGEAGTIPSRGVRVWAGLRARAPVREVVLIAAALFYLVIAPWAGRAAVDDLFSRGTDLAVRAEAIVVLAASFVWLVAGLRLVWDELAPPPEAAPASWSAKTVPVAGLLGVVLGLVALVHVSSRGGHRDFGPIFIVLTFALLSLGCLLIKGRETAGLLSRASKILVTLGVTVWGIFQFWYANQYAPTQGGVVLNVDTKLEKVDSNVPGLTALMATVKVFNPGDSRATVLASEYTISGYTTSVRTSPSPTASPSVVVVPGFGNSPGVDPQVNRFSRLTQESGGEVFQTAELLRNGSHVEPGQSIVRTYIAYVPPDAGLLRLEASVAAANATNIDLGERVLDPTPLPASARKHSKPGTVRLLTRLHQPSAIARLFGPPPGVFVEYDPTSAPTNAIVSLYWGPEPPSNVRLRNLHVGQIVVTSSIYETPLPAAPSPSPSSPPAARGRRGRG